jgi:hypothetical protein
MADPTIFQTYHNAPGSTGPYVIPAQGAGTTRVLLRLTDEKDGENFVYRTVTYVVGPCGPTSVTVAAPTTWCVVVDLPDGIDTKMAAISALFPTPPKITPADGSPPPPAPGTVKGGNAM